MSISRKGFVSAAAVFLAITVPVRAGVLTLAPTAFHPAYPAQANYWVTSVSMTYATAPASTFGFVAPVNLPNGAVIKKITVFLTDNGSVDADHVSVSLYRAPLAQNSYVCAATLDNHSPVALPHSAVPQKLSKTDILYRTVNNSTYSYSVMLQFYANCVNVQFHGMKIEY